MNSVKTISILLSALFLITGARAQSTAEEVEKEFYKSDMIISIIISTLPSNYSFTEKGGRFLILRSDSVWILEENRLNAPKESREARAERIRKNGKKTWSGLVFRYEDRWDAARLEMLSIQNAAYQEEINKLPEKYKITHLLDKSKGGKGNPVYKATNDSEKRQIEKFERERAELLKKIIRLPDFHSQKYSLFLETSQGINDEEHLVYPDAASVDLFTILATFREVCGK